jgi:NADH-quinone oxidoreductase subunit G
MVNNEGRAQRYYKALVNKDQVKESWRWIGELIKAKDKNRAVLWNRFDDIVSALVKELPVFSKLQEYLPDADFRMLNAKIPRQTVRFSGRTAMNANITVSEPVISQDSGSPLAFSMEGQPEHPPSSFVPFYWTPGWNSVQAMNNYLDEPNGSMKGGDPGIRLIEPSEGGDNSYFKIKPQTFEIQKDEWLIVPVYQVFGSEELSSAGTSIAQRIQEPFVFLDQKDADIIGTNDGDLIQLEISENRLKIRVKIENSLQHGIAGLSVNLPGMQFIDLPGRGKFYKNITICS